MKILSILKFTTITGVGTWNYTFLKELKKQYPEIEIEFLTKFRGFVMIRIPAPPGGGITIELRM